MGRTALFNDIKQELDAALAGTTGAAPPRPLNRRVSPWLAASLLQKSIRRGQTQWAMAAADHMLRIDPDRLWRRLLIIAFEDVGIANLQLIAQATAATQFRRTYEQRGMAATAVHFMAKELAASPKCRASDDSYTTIEGSSEISRFMQERFDWPLPDLMACVMDSQIPIEERTSALWLALGTQQKGVTGLPVRRGQPKATFDLMIDLGWPHTLVEIARAGYAKTGEIICAFIPLLLADWRSLDDVGDITCPSPQAPRWQVRDDAIPPLKTDDAFGIPLFALDQFTREGQWAMRRFLQGPSETARLVRNHIAVDERRSVFGLLLFYADSSLLKKRLVWTTGADLRHRATAIVSARFGSDADLILNQMRSDLPLLDAIRAEAANTANSL
ncbi:hypothetical protein [Roseitalea porphyridii]|uniref:MgsA AAA+ ATPase C-terminal domain-containing protein n=1 Tax=Roseitalea porphyridii TaxID=1852022 RepID=A0A4P6V0I3_9HYPH|nr:hypothetical protein [Roseitalea porphyridii]QBK30144.1 hypothetical protein E0E05_05750 [Roseitalea porphyridii]